MPSTLPDRRIDALYRDWARHRTDLERLRLLREAIDECLGSRSAGAS